MQLKEETVPPANVWTCSAMDIPSSWKEPSQESTSLTLNNQLIFSTAV